MWASVGSRGYNSADKLTTSRTDRVTADVTAHEKSLRTARLLPELAEPLEPNSFEPNMKRL